MTGIKENGIKHCYRADKGNTLLEPSLKVLFIKFGWGATFKRLDVKCRKCKWLPSLEKAYSQLLHYLESHRCGGGDMLLPNPNDYFNNKNKKKITGHVSNLHKSIRLYLLI